MVYIPNETVEKKHYFSFLSSYQFEIASLFGLDTCAIKPYSTGSHLAQTPEGTVYAVTVFAI